jgi:hypothetical protein
MLLSEEFWTSKEVAALIRVTPAALRQWRQRGVGPRWLNAERRILYRKSDVEAWLEEQYNTPHAS